MAHSLPVFLSFTASPPHAIRFSFPFLSPGSGPSSPVLSRHNHISGTKSLEAIPHKFLEHFFPLTSFFSHLDLLGEVLPISTPKPPTAKTFIRVSPLFPIRLSHIEWDNQLFSPSVISRTPLCAPQRVLGGLPYRYSDHNGTVPQYRDAGAR